MILKGHISSACEIRLSAVDRVPLGFTEKQVFRRKWAKMELMAQSNSLSQNLQKLHQQVSPEDSCISCKERGGEKKEVIGENQDLVMLQMSERQVKVNNGAHFKSNGRQKNLDLSHMLGVFVSVQ